MKILLANDDGIHAKGLRMMAKALSKDNTVYVVAPDSQRSGYSHFTSFRKPIYCAEEQVEGAATAYSISGTPSDCIKFALIHLHIKPDIVISGPNEGANYGTDIIYSGTVSAAQEACLMGMRSLAVSCRRHKGEFLYDSCIEFTLKHLEKFAAFMHPYTFLNINVPSLPMNEIKGVAAARMGIYTFNDRYDEAEEDGKKTYTLDGEPNNVADEYFDSDVHAARSGYIAITPIKTDRTNYDLMEKVAELFK